MCSVLTAGLSQWVVFLDVYLPLFQSGAKIFQCLSIHCYVYFSVFRSQGGNSNIALSLHYLIPGHVVVLLSQFGC